ncbi:flagellar basal-body MS-ring/collar protein FliF [Tropicimonas sp. IMCC34043]|uniref:flagellar basal-body MS-ring/collar protein FliF n=1 Tax=Tropicimonas sp. IMCC34043 TaxID=2248760 RepID=UPI000E262F46|nr:flagellar basal-body MS-ring/collar protein FliF [Tropicimonas sp. IMCC34043]
MQNLIRTWSALDTRRRVIVGLATLAMFVAVLLLSGLASKPKMELLYAGLDGQAAGEVIVALDQRGVVYDVRGSAIYVEAGARDQLRMLLAVEGLPANGPAGYELLDGLSGFGTTSQMFDAAYWRAKEGELARTIMASPQIRSARVHISRPPNAGFRQEATPAASVFVTPSSDGISDAQGRALRFLVASAVAGMKPENVSVIDGESGVVLGSGDEVGAVAAGKREAVLKRNVERLVEARVGPGNAIVELSLETVTERESIVERRFDPDGRVAISTDTEERSTASRGQNGGAVTVASNLPDGDANAKAGDSSSQNSESRERVNFEVSQTQRELVRVPGSVKRLSVAVLVNTVRSSDASGREVSAQRPDEELDALRALIAAAVGFDESRGDQITIRSMEFRPTEVSGALPASHLIDRLDLMAIAQIAILSIVAVILGLFVVRPILARRETPKMLELPPTDEAKAGPDKAAQASAARALTGEIADDGYAPAMQVVSGRGVEEDMRPGSRVLTAEPQDPVARLRLLIKEREHETIEVLRSWMEDEKEKA